MARSRKPIAPVIPDGEDLDPDPMDYSPKQVLAETEAAKDLMLWMRREGVTCDVITVGHVQLTNVVDHFPRQKVADQMRGHAGGRQKSRAHDVDDFATPEERAILNGEESDE